KLRDKEKKQYRNKEAQKEIRRKEVNSRKPQPPREAAAPQRVSKSVGSPGKTETRVVIKNIIPKQSPLPTSKRLVKYTLKTR
ncbi:hypothetical protein ACJMK2_010039, partial [Sinanodonta woodiana]